MTSRHHEIPVLHRLSISPILWRLWHIYYLLCFDFPFTITILQRLDLKNCRYVWSNIDELKGFANVQPIAVLRICAGIAAASYNYSNEGPQYAARIHSTLRLMGQRISYALRGSIVRYS